MRGIVFILILGFFYCSSTVLALAASLPLFPVPERQYEVMRMEGDGGNAQSYYAELQGDPHMYEMIAQDPFVLNVELAQASFGAVVKPLSYVIVEALVSGKVREVSRVRPSIEGWQPVRDRFLGITFQSAQTFSLDLPAGTYRIEVSSPENIGKYRLTTGRNSTHAGYVGNWQTILAVNSFFDRSIFALIASRFVQIHLLVAVMGFLLWKYAYPWWTRRTSHNHA